MNIWIKIRTACGELAPDCRAAVRAQSEALDHPLTLKRRFGLWAHLLLCKWCRRYGRQIQFLRRAAHEHPEQSAAPAQVELSGAARERIKQRLRDQK
jgi:hypothetical protein